MKEHEYRALIKRSEDFYWFGFNGNFCYNTLDELGVEGVGCYVDSNNYLHNLNGPAWCFSGMLDYHIHGKQYTKEEWDIERNRLLMLEEL